MSCVVKTNVYLYNTIGKRNRKIEKEDRTENPKGHKINRDFAFEEVFSYK